jgi:pyrroloquinoline-quinone synthase
MKELIDRILDETNAAQNAYFVGLRDGTFERDDFLETQIQFYYAVVFFSRPMAAVAAKIPSARMRIEILRNVWEEHGEGDVRGMHGETFKLLLERLGGTGTADIERRQLWPELRAFNTVLIGCAVMDDWQVGTACLGMIERMFAEISAWIGRAIVERSWIRREDLVHYSLHEIVDIRHADDFFAALETAWQTDERNRYLIEQGLRLGAFVFDRLYADLYAARQRRVLSPLRLPQPNVYSG